MLSGCSQQGVLLVRSFAGACSQASKNKGDNALHCFSLSSAKGRVHCTMLHAVRKKTGGSAVQYLACCSKSTKGQEASTSGRLQCITLCGVRKQARSKQANAQGSALHEFTCCSKANRGRTVHYHVCCSSTSKEQAFEQHARDCTAVSRLSISACLDSTKGSALHFRLFAGSFGELSFCVLLLTPCLISNADANEMMLCSLPQAF